MIFLLRKRDSLAVRRALPQAPHPLMENRSMPLTQRLICERRASGLTTSRTSSHSGGKVRILQSGPEAQRAALAWSSAAVPTGYIAVVSPASLRRDHVGMA